MLLLKVLGRSFQTLVDLHAQKGFLVCRGFALSGCKCQVVRMG